MIKQEDKNMGNEMEMKPTGSGEGGGRLEAEKTSSHPQNAIDQIPSLSPTSPTPEDQDQVKRQPDPQPDPFDKFLFYSLRARFRRGVAYITENWEKWSPAKRQEEAGVFQQAVVTPLDREWEKLSEPDRVFFLEAEK